MNIEILKNFVGFKTITPYGEDAINYCSDFLENLGFKCEKFQIEDVTNLYAKFGNFDKNICFAGHIDVVPPLDGWSTDPFILIEKDDKFYGRGTNDMKGPLSSALASVCEFLQNHNNFEFSISFMLTSDEEIMGDNGTKKLVEILKSRNEKITCCVLCESCSPKESGEYIKIGCRGSLNVDFKSYGKQGHVVNGKILGNHLHDFIEFLNDFSKLELDKGNENFDPSDIEITSIDVGNDVRNIIPNLATAKLNIRFNDLWTHEKLENFIKSKSPENIEVSFERFGYPFVGASQKFINFLKNSIHKSFEKIPYIGTSGGNSDAVFIKNITEVVEIGTPIAGAHIIDEFISKSDLAKLRNLYFNILKDFKIYI